MKVKNIDLKGLSLIHYDKAISFDENGLSEDLADWVAKELATLPGYELVEEKKPEEKKPAAKKPEDKKPEDKKPEDKKAEDKKEAKKATKTTEGK